MREFLLKTLEDEKEKKFNETRNEEPILEELECRKRLGLTGKQPDRNIEEMEQKYKEDILNLTRDLKKNFIETSNIIREDREVKNSNNSVFLSL